MRPLATALLALAASPAVIAAQIGVMAGYNHDSFSGFSDERFALSDEIDGFNTGIFLDFAIGRLGIRTAMVYRRLPGAVTEDGDSPVSDLEIIELPLELRVTAPLPVARPYVVMGPTLIFPSSSRPPVDEALAGARLQLGVGVGVEWDIGFRLWPEIRYGRSLGGLVENDETGGSKLDTFVIRLGISF